MNFPKVFSFLYKVENLRKRGGLIALFSFFWSVALYLGPFHLSLIDGMGKSQVVLIDYLAMFYLWMIIVFIFSLSLIFDVRSDIKTGLAKNLMLYPINMLTYTLAKLAVFLREMFWGGIVALVMVYLLSGAWKVFPVYVDLHILLIFLTVLFVAIVISLIGVVFIKIPMLSDLFVIGYLALVALKMSTSMGTSGFGGSVIENPGYSLVKGLVGNGYGDFIVSLVIYIIVFGLSMIPLLYKRGRWML